MNQNKKAIIVALVIVAALLAIIMVARYGRNAITNKKTQKPADTQQNKPEDEPKPEKPKDISLKTESGEGGLNYSAEGKAKISEKFPLDVFVYPDAKVTFMAENVTATDLYTVVYITESKPEEAVEKYKQEMEKDSWEKKDEINVPTNGAKVLTFKKNKRMVSVLIGSSQEEEHKGKTQIQVAETQLAN